MAVYRSPEIRQKFKSYADSARLARADLKNNTVAAITRVVNTNPLENKGIMNAVNLHMLAYLSLAKASKLPELKNTDQATLKLVSKGALLNSAEDYVTRLKFAPRRNQELQPVANAIAEQFIKDSQQPLINTGDYVLKDEYGVTKVYRVTENNSKVVFNVKFYFYGGILSGWSVEPGEDLFLQQK